MKVVLTIAGSDSSGGAGIQADLKTFEAFGLFGTSAITVLTAQNTTGVRSIETLSTKFIKEQIEAVLEDFDVAAIKIGMLFSEEIITTIEDIIKDLDIPIVLDPVFISKVGSPLLEESAVEAMKTLFKYASLITPNMHEAQQLFGYDSANPLSIENIFSSPCPVLVKHEVIQRDNTLMSVDKLYQNNKVSEIITPLIVTTNLHGTGCSYSSAIAANIALGKELHEAIKISKNFIHCAIEKAPNIGDGAGPINHKEGLTC